MDKKQQGTALCGLQEAFFKYKDLDKLNVRGWKKINYAKTNQNKIEVILLVSDTADFRGKENDKG